MSMGKLPKPNNIVKIETSLSTDFFRWWCTFLRPFVNLTNRELDVMACFLKHRYELGKSISDPAILDAVVMSTDVKKKVLEECKMTQEYFYVVMSNLKRNKVIVNDAINPRLIPNVREDESTGYFQLLLLFKMQDDVSGIGTTSSQGA